MRRFYLGDVHGNIKALKQVLERSSFDYENDQLITIGDIVDGWAWVYECVEELLKIKNRIDVRGNHDQWFVDWLETGLHSENWAQGGEGTLKSYGKNCLGDSFKMLPKNSGGWITHLNPGDIPETHKEFFKHQVFHYVDEDNNCFVHGGFNRHISIDKQPVYVLMWDRDLFMAAMSFKTMGRTTHPSTGKPYKFEMKDKFNKVFIGHTSTENWSTDERNEHGIIIPGKKAIQTPIKAANIINGDTGAGYNGKLSLINIDTEECFQSDNNLYPGERGR